MDLIIEKSPPFFKRSLRRMNQIAYEKWTRLFPKSRASSSKGVWQVKNGLAIKKVVSL